MKRLNARQVEAFRAVMALGGMTRAAEMLQISQPAVSRLVADLEEAVGFTLFRRRRQGAVPTEDARRFHTEVDSLFVGLDELSRRAEAIRRIETGHVRIAALGLYAHGLLPPIVARFLALHPGLDVRLDVVTHEQLIDRLNGGGCDIGLTSLPAYSGDLEVQVLARRSATCVLPAGHRLAAQPVVDVTDLAGEDYISFPRGTAARYQIDSTCERAAVVRRMRVEVSTHEAACNLVAAGAGIAVVNPFSPLRDSDPRLVFRPFTPNLPFEIGLLTNPERLCVAASLFRATVVAGFEEPI